MAISRLALTDFRSWRDLVIEAEPGLVILTGENGAGKTNILEAISLLAPGRGLRGAALGEMARSDGPGGFAVAARLGDGGELGVGALAVSPERRQVRINGAAAPANALAERLSLLWLTPAMDRLFVEGAGGRRRFVDRLVLALEPEHAHHSLRYDAAMRERNRLLAGPDRPDETWLAGVESAMATHGVAIDVARAETMRLLDARLAGLDDAILATPAIALGAWTGEDGDPGGFGDALRDSRARDAQAGRALLGPHRSDLIVRHRRKDQPAARSSTGEQKSMLLKIVLAHADLVADRRGERPLLLLDEIAAHLDPARREALLALLAEPAGQTWLTGTDPALFPVRGGRTAAIAPGVLMLRTA